MAFDRTKPADTDYISASAANLRENFRALAEDTRLYGTGAPESSAGQNGWRYVDTATGDEYLKVNGAWIKKTDLAALITALLGEDIYKRSNIIGTVGQISGVPIGAVIESGLNANGEYIKFADGTMICNKVFTSIAVDISTAWGALYVSNNIGLGNWAATFTATPVISYTCNNGSYFLILPLATQTATTAGAVVAARPIADTARSRSLNVIGIGRWF